MRQLQTSDIFGFVRIIEESGAKEDLVPVLKNINKDTDAIDVGVIGMLTFAFSLCKVESSIYKWLARIAEVDPEELQDLDVMSKVLEDFEGYDQTSLKRFFTAALRLLQKIS